MNQQFMEIYAKQRQDDISKEFDRIHLTRLAKAKRRGAKAPLLFCMGQFLINLGNWLQRRYEVPEPDII
jgi:hypothetical protein